MVRDAILEGKILPQKVLADRGDEFDVLPSVGTAYDGVDRDDDHVGKIVFLGTVDTWIGDGSSLVKKGGEIRHGDIPDMACESTP